MSEEVKVPTWDEVESMTFNASLNRIRVRVVAVEEKTTGGIILSKKEVDKEQNAVSVGVVLDMGDDAYVEYADKRIKPGSVVLFARYAGAKTPGNGFERIINDTDVYGVANG